MPAITQSKPVTLRALMELLQSHPDDAGFLDAPLSILVTDGNRNCERVYLENLGWHHLPRRDHGANYGGKDLSIACHLSEHRLVKLST